MLAPAVNLVVPAGANQALTHVAGALSKVTVASGTTVAAVKVGCVGAAFTVKMPSEAVEVPIVFT